MNNIEESYYYWLVSLIEDKHHSQNDYSLLLRKLYDTDFICALQKDENRLVDGLHLRFRFLSKNGYSRDYYSDIKKECSILEMIIALSIRIEENIMGNSMDGFFPNKWFWVMIYNLGLDHLSNDLYEENIVNSTLNNFIFRKYRSNGEGNLFVINNKGDIRDVEIWLQMNWFISNYDEERENV